MSLQTSIARHLARRHLHPDSEPGEDEETSPGGSSLTTTSVTITTSSASSGGGGTRKPTASVMPVFKQDSRQQNSELESPMDIDDASCSNNGSQLTLDDSTESNSPAESGSKPASFLASLSAADATDCVGDKQDTDGSSSSNNQTLLNGGVSHPPDAVPNGPASSAKPNGPASSAKPNGPISLLSGSLSPTSLHPAGNEVLKASDLLTGKTDSLLAKSRNDSTVARSAASHTNKNVVISSVNKQTGVIATKVVTATTQGAKVRA